MDNIDALQINFSQDQLFLLNFCLAFLMFSIALDIKMEDFKAIVKNPKLPIIGVISQYLLLPLINLLIIFIFQPPPSVALGMTLVAVCPGGTTSNYAVYLAKANTALSVMLTSISTVAAILFTPLSYVFWTSFLSGTEALSEQIKVEPYQMVETFVFVIILPLFLGMFLRAKFPSFTEKIEKWVKGLAMLIFISFVILALIGNFDNIKDYLSTIFIIVLFYNGLALLVGYYFTRLNGFSAYHARSISIETGIQNSGLALILIFNFFDGLGGMALVAAWWGIWHLISGFVLAMYWGQRPVPTS